MTNFNSKETYLAARAEWKANYARLTLDARKYRAEVNEAQRNEDSTRSSFYKTNSPESSKAYRDAMSATYHARSSRSNTRYEANEALAHLVVMKQEASRQWNEQRST